jgi:hypothetical protein
MRDLDRNDNDLEKNELMSCSQRVVQTCDTEEPDGMRRHTNGSRE